MRVFRVASVALGALVGLAGSAEAGAISWTVDNNFRLLGNRDTQVRFKRELAAHIECMKKSFSPGQCANNRTTFGLTQQPYALRFNAKLLAYDPETLHPRDGGASDTVNVNLSLDGAGANQRCDWRVGGKPHSNVACKGFHTSVKIGEPVTVVADPRGKGDTGETTITVRRVVIATFGDSFMSGEGNPHIRSRVQPVKSENWLEPRCHRSLMTSSAQAAFRWADENPKALVAYYNFACSGSTAEKGLLGDYEGVISSRTLDNLRGDGEESVHFRGAKLPSQVDQAKRLLCNKGDCVSPDVLFLSIGINTLKFSDTIIQLGGKTCDDACRSGLEGRIKSGLETLAGDGKGSLRDAYRQVSRAIAPKRAFAIEYPDPTRDEKGGYCDSNALFPVFGKFSMGRIDRKENGWAFEKMLVPLNKSVVEAAAQVDGWQVVSGSAEATKRHGFCSKETFFNSGQDAKGTSGTMHPNVVGHEAVARLLKAVLDRELAVVR